MLRRIGGKLAVMACGTLAAICLMGGVAHAGCDGYYCNVGVDGCTDQQMRSPDVCCVDVNGDGIKHCSQCS